MNKIPFVRINGTLYTFSKYIENLAAEMGTYDVYEYDAASGDGHTGPRHPGTVTVQAFKKVCADPVLRKRNNARTTNFAKVDFGVHKPNDDLVNYLVHEKVISKYDMDVTQTSLNVFDEVAAQAIIRVLNRNLDLVLIDDLKDVMPRIFTGCLLSPVLVQPKDQRVKRKLF